MINGQLVSLVSQKARDSLKKAWEKRREITLLCPWCGWTADGCSIGPYKRYHGDRCKLKPVEPVGPELDDEPVRPVL